MCDVSLEGNNRGCITDKRDYAGCGDAVIDDVRDRNEVGAGKGDNIDEDFLEDNKADVCHDNAAETRLSITAAADCYDDDDDDEEDDDDDDDDDDGDDYSSFCSDDDLCDVTEQYSGYDDDEGTERYSDVNLCEEYSGCDSSAYVSDEYSHLRPSDDDYGDGFGALISCDDNDVDDGCHDDDDDDDDDGNSDYVDDADGDGDGDADGDDVEQGQEDDDMKPCSRSTEDRQIQNAISGLFGGHRSGVGRPPARSRPISRGHNSTQGTSVSGSRSVTGSRSASRCWPASGRQPPHGIQRTSSLPVARGGPTAKGRRVARGGGRLPPRSQSERRFLPVNPDGRPKEEPTWYDQRYLQDIQCCTKYSELVCTTCACIASAVSKCNKGPYVREFCIATTSVLIFTTLAVYLAMLARSPEKLPHRCYCLLLHLIFCTLACFCTVAVSAVCGVYACDPARVVTLTFCTFAAVLYFTDLVHSYREYRDNEPEGTRRWTAWSKRQDLTASWAKLFGRKPPARPATKSPAWHDITPEQVEP